MNVIEIIGVFCTLTGIYLATQRKIFTWPLQIIASVLYTWLFFKAHLFGEALLQLLYALLAIYGWRMWTTKEKRVFTASYLSLKQGVILNTVAILATLLIAQLQVHFLPTNVPYLDSFIFTFGIFAQWMQASYKIENWLYWIILDITAAGIYWHTQLYFTAGLYIVLALIALYGWKQWHRSHHI